MTDLCAVCAKYYETCDAYDGDSTIEQDGSITRCEKYQMSEKEAKKIILHDPAGSIVKRLEAIEVARSILGDDCSMEEIWKWAEGGDSDVAE